MTGDVTGHGRRWHNVGSDPLKDVYDQYDRMLNFRIIELLLSTRIDGAIIHEENNPDPAADRRFPCGRSEFRALLRSGAPHREGRCAPARPNYLPIERRLNLDESTRLFIAKFLETYVQEIRLGWRAALLGPLTSSFSEGQSALDGPHGPRAAVTLYGSCTPDSCRLDVVPQVGSRGPKG